MNPLILRTLHIFWDKSLMGKWIDFFQNRSSVEVRIMGPFLKESTPAERERLSYLIREGRIIAYIYLSRREVNKKVLSSLEKIGIFPIITIEKRSDLEKVEKAVKLPENSVLRLPLRISSRAFIPVWLNFPQERFSSF